MLKQIAMLFLGSCRSPKSVENQVELCYPYGPNVVGGRQIGAFRSPSSCPCELYPPCTINGCSDACPPVAANVLDKNQLLNQGGIK